MSLTYKNLICSVLHINLLQFLIPAIIQIPPCIYTGLLIGRSLKSLNDLDSYSFFSDWKLIVCLVFYVLMFGFTVVMMWYIAKWVRQGWNDEELENDEKDIDEDVKNGLKTVVVADADFEVDRKEIPLVIEGDRKFFELKEK